MEALGREHTCEWGDCSLVREQGCGGGGGGGCYFSYSAIKGLEMRRLVRGGWQPHLQVFSAHRGPGEFHQTVKGPVKSGIGMKSLNVLLSEEKDWEATRLTAYSWNSQKNLEKGSSK